MEIIITGALPPKHIVAALIKELPSDAAFIKRLQQHQANLHQLDSELIGCTPAEYYQVQQQDFSSTAGQRYVDALPALDYLNKSIDEYHGIYNLALCNIHVDFQSTRLFPNNSLHITKEQSLALFESVKYLFAENKIKLIAINDDHWVISLPQCFATSLDSPKLLSYQPLHDHWPKEEKNKKLRQLLNEVQMLWHEHPVNIERKAQGLREINSPWIYGGAHPQQLQAQPQYPYAVISTLEEAYRNEDWGRWLDLLPQLEADIASAQKADAEANPNILRRGAITKSTTATRFVLAGYDQLITLTPLSFWQRTMARLRPSTDWKSWWHQS